MQSIAVNLTILASARLVRELREVPWVGKVREIVVQNRCKDGMRMCQCLYEHWSTIITPNKACSLGCFDASISQALLSANLTPMFRFCALTSIPRSATPWKV